MSLRLVNKGKATEPTRVVREMIWAEKNLGLDRWANKCKLTKAND